MLASHVNIYINTHQYYLTGYWTYPIEADTTSVTETCGAKYIHVFIVRQVMFMTLVSEEVSMDTIHHLSIQTQKVRK